MGTDRRNVIAVVSLVAVLFLPATVFCDERPGGRPKEQAEQPQSEVELTEQEIERIMEWLAENSPSDAEQLDRLRWEDPDEFRQRAHRLYRRHFGPGQTRGEGRRERFGNGGPGEPERWGPMGPGVRMRPGRGGPGEMDRVIREHLEERYTRFFEWLDENYPEDAERLRRLRERKPELYLAQLRVTYRRYKSIMEEDNPQIVEVLKQDLELKDQRNRLLERIRRTDDEQKKRELTGRLEEVISRRFDLILERKQLEYEELRARLEELQEQVAESEERLAGLREAKAENVEKRVGELLGNTEKISWE